MAEECRDSKQPGKFAAARESAVNTIPKLAKSLSKEERAVLLRDDLPKLRKAVPDLNDLIDPELAESGWVLNEAIGINNSGQITAFAYNRFTNDEHSVLLTPRSVPEPNSTLLVMAALLAAFWHKSKFRRYFDQPA